MSRLCSWYYPYRAYVQPRDEWLRFSSLQGTGWLLLAKWMLYLAPLPSTALLTLRGDGTPSSGGLYGPVGRLRYMLYSFFRLSQAMGGRYSNAYVDGTMSFSPWECLEKCCRPKDCRSDRTR